jgi:uncharacterized protein (TIGR02145 family)/gliding motility-associated-like protein
MRHTIKKKSISGIIGLLLFIFSSSAFAQGSDHSCGAPNVHNSAVTYGQVSDIDGNVYKTVLIDSLVWFAENLRVSRFQNGEIIPQVSDSASWASLSGPGMCSYKNDSSFDCPMGKLYNFYVASDPANPCPAGWRVPSQEDFNKLINYFDPDANGGAPSNLPNNAGGYLKCTGLSYWQAPNPNSTNVSGFSAIPNGGRNNEGKFSNNRNRAAEYWYSTPLGPGMGFFLQMAHTQDWAVRNAYWNGYGICIRCVSNYNPCNGLIQASSDTCEGNQVEFSVLGPALQAVSWNFGDPGSGTANTSTAQTPVHVFSGAGDYQVQAIATFACGVDTLNYPIRIADCSCTGNIAASVQDSCAGDFVFSVNSIRSIQQLQWNFGDPQSGNANISTQLQPPHRFSRPGRFDVSAVVQFSCGSDTLRFTVNVPECVCSGVIRSIGPDSCGETFSFSVESDKSLLLVSWNFGNPASGALNSSSEFTPVHRYGASGNYKVRAIVLFDCGLDTLERILSVRLCEKAPCEIFIPNAFSPNGDDVNEGFCPRANCTFEEYELRLYNRWGQQIFLSKNPEEEWKPAVEGKAGDVYFYTIRYRFAFGQTAQEKGTLTLLGNKQ